MIHLKIDHYADIILATRLAQFRTSSFDLILYLWGGGGRSTIGYDVLKVFKSVHNELPDTSHLLLCIGSSLFLVRPRSICIRVLRKSEPR